MHFIVRRRRFKMQVFYGLDFFRAGSACQLMLEPHNPALVILKLFFCNSVRGVQGITHGVQNVVDLGVNPVNPVIQPGYVVPNFSYILSQLGYYILPQRCRLLRYSGSYELLQILE